MSLKKNVATNHISLHLGEQCAFAVRIILSGTNSGITDYKSLQQYGKFDWKLQRVLWIGYKKNVYNKKCSFAVLSKDVIGYIIKFLLIDDKNDNTSSYMMHFPNDTMFKDIANKYSCQLDENVIKFFENNPHFKKYIGPNACAEIQVAIIIH